MLQFFSAAMGWANLSSGKHEKLAYTSKFTLINKIASCLFATYKSYKFSIPERQNWPWEHLVSLLQTFKVGINIYFSNVASKYGVMF